MDSQPDDLATLKAELALARARNADDAATIARQKLELVELGHPIEDAGEFGLQPRGLLIGNGDAGKAGNTANGGTVDGHGFVGVSRGLKIWDFL